MPSARTVSGNAERQGAILQGLGQQVSIGGNSRNNRSSKNSRLGR